MKIIPVKEPAPSLPVAPKGARQTPRVFGDTQLFGFDTETTTCGKKEIRCYQAAWIDRETGCVNALVNALSGYLDSESIRTVNQVVGSLLSGFGVKRGVITIQTFDTVDELRCQSQRDHEDLIYSGKPALNPKGNGTRRKVDRCAVAFNANFDMGVLSDSTTLKDDMTMGGMEGAGVIYHFTSGQFKTVEGQWGMPNIKCLFLGADNVPFVAKRGVVWDIRAASKHLWGCPNLRAVGKRVGLDKLAPKFNDAAYAVMDAVVTLFGAIHLTRDLTRMGFTNAPDRFISGATVAKDLMKQHYSPFYLTQEQHDSVWPAYMGGMTGAVRPTIVRTQVTDVAYGDLDGAYNVCGQRLEVFSWGACRQVSEAECHAIIAKVKANPTQYWKYGSLHLRVTGDFDFCPVRVATVGDDSEEPPTTSHGLVWAEMRDYSTTLSLGDFLHAKPSNLRIHCGFMADRRKDGDSPCLFKMTADERAKFPKFDADGEPIMENWVPNSWFKLAGNCAYGSFANRNGKHREQSGKWFNVLIASSITAGIRHLMHIVNEAAGDDGYYNDTDSGLVKFSALPRCQDALKPLGVGFSNKTGDELPSKEVASFAIVQGSKRYCMVAHDGTFGAKCHGLGSWFVSGPSARSLGLTERPYDSVSIAHNEEILECVWATNYPEYLGVPRREIQDLKVFHQFNIKTKRVSEMVKRYAVERLGADIQEWRYGKAGQFGFISPTIVNGKVVPVVSWSVEDAERLSDLTLGQVAYRWGRSQDKKFNYANQSRWRWDGSEVRLVTSVANSQALNAGQQTTLKGDVSVHVLHEKVGPK